MTQFPPDITRGRAHRVLSKSDFRQILLHVPAGIAILEGPDFRYAYINDRLAEINGLPVEEHLGRPLADVLPAAAPDIASRLRQVMESRTTAQDHEFSTVLPGDPNRVRHFVDSFFPIVSQDGNVNAICAVVLDLTEQKRLQERLVQAQKTEMVATLAAGIAHDFNNLLMTVLGNASLALIELPQDSPLRRGMHDIEDAASHGAALVKQMLDYAGEGKVSREPVDVSKLIERLNPLLGTTVPDTVVIDYNLHNGLPSIMTDPTQVSQVVINLITNASEAIGGAEGVITVSTGMLTHDADGSGSAFQTEIPSGTYVYIEVSDTGLGMDAATQAKMWDPFFTTKFAGRGLGLAAVQGIVRSYGGATKVVSQPGRGTQVRTLFAVTE